MKTRLDFLVIGAQKCATSWLYYCLKDHAQLKLPEKKREVEYLGGDLFERNGPEWYFSLFEGARSDQIVGAVSIEYMFDRRALGAVQEFAPNVKLIASLRNPIDRAVSGYFWYLRKGLIPDMGLEQTFQTALEELRCTSGRQNGGACSELLSRGFYDEQLARYVQRFGKEKFLFVLYEDIQERPLDVLRKIYEFLGADSSFKPPSLNARPKQNTYLKSLISLERAGGRSVILGKVMNSVNRAVSALRLNREKPLLSSDLYSELTEIFTPHITNTQRIIDAVPSAQRPFSENLIQRWLGRTKR